MICCTNKCIINERYIPEHQNKLNIAFEALAKMRGINVIIIIIIIICDLQNYEFFTNFFSTEKKFVKFVIFYEWKKFVKFEFSIYARSVSVSTQYVAPRHVLLAPCSI